MALNTASVLGRCNCNSLSPPEVRKGKVRTMVLKISILPINFSKMGYSQPQILYFSNKNFQPIENFPTGQNLGAFLPCHDDATTTIR